MDPNELQARTKLFALRVIKLAQYLGNQPLGKLIGKQIFRSGTSVAANYRAVCKSKSVKDFISKLGIVIEEADETVFWLELLHDSEMVKGERVLDLLQEAKEITAIMVASRNTSIKKQRQK